MHPSQPLDLDETCAALGMSRWAPKVASVSLPSGTFNGKLNAEANSTFTGPGVDASSGTTEDLYV